MWEWKEEILEHEPLYKWMVVNRRFDETNELLTLSRILGPKAPVRTIAVLATVVYRNNRIRIFTGPVGLDQMCLRSCGNVKMKS